MRGILAQALMALLVIKEQIGSARAIHLHVFQFPKDRVALQYMHDHPCIPGGWGRPGQSVIITSSIMAYSSAGVSSIPSPTSASALDSSCTKIAGRHPAMCTPLGHLGNTSLQNPCTCQSPSQVHNSYN